MERAVMRDAWSGAAVGDDSRSPSPTALAVEYAEAADREEAVERDAADREAEEGEEEERVTVNEDADDLRAPWAPATPVGEPVAPVGDSEYSEDVEHFSTYQEAEDVL